MTAKDLKWIGSARADIQALPDEAKRQLGYDLRLVQLGQTPRSWRPMPSDSPVPIRIHRSSGNVFKDIGFPREEAAHLLIRTDLMIQATALINERGLTQKQAAKALGVTQPRISDLTRGRIELFSIDTLVEMLTRLGVEVTLKTKRRSRVA